MCFTSDYFLRMFHEQKIFLLRYWILFEKTEIQEINTSEKYCIKFKVQKKKRR